LESFVLGLFYLSFYSLTKQEEYVRRNLTQDEMDGIIRDPELVYAEREQMKKAFAPDEVSPKSPTR
jgi:hypothetical protein